MSIRSILLWFCLPLVAIIAFRCIPDGVWANREIREIERLDEKARRFGGSAGIPGAIDYSSRQMSVPLGLGGTSVGDAELARIVAMPGFRHVYVIDLSRTRISDAGLKCLEGNSKLQHLDLSDTQVTDECFRSLATLPQFSSLSIKGTRISDAGLRILIDRTSNPRMSCIDLTNTKVTEEGVLSLKSAFKKIYVFSQFNVAP